MLVYVVNFDLFELSAAILEEGLFSRQCLIFSSQQTGKQSSPESVITRLSDIYLLTGITKPLGAKLVRPGLNFAFYMHLI